MGKIFSEMTGSTQSEGTTEKKLEKRLRELAADMVTYNKYEYPVEWKKSADQWNMLLDKFDCHELATKIRNEYGLT